jgi:hypothetical protein
VINEANNNIFIIGITGVFSMLLAPSLNVAPANAINDKFTTNCERNGEVVSSGSCPGQSEKSPNKQDTVTNPSDKNQPPGQQPPDPNPRDR